jgi:hypothetical protein
MNAEYDLSKLTARRNRYVSKLKKPVTMRLSEDVLVYFKDMAEEARVPYQSLINLHLRDCLAQSRKGNINWPQAAAKSSMYRARPIKLGPASTISVFVRFKL